MPSRNTRSGRKPPKSEDPCFTREELTRLRDGFTSFQARHGALVHTFQGWTPRPKKKPTRTKPGTWQRRFLTAYSRTGSADTAAKIAGIPIGTVRSALYRQTQFRNESELMHGRFIWRQIQRLAIRPGLRLELRKTAAAALLRYLNSTLENTAASPHHSSAPPPEL